MDNETESKSITEILQDIAELANGVAALCVGHKKILSEGDFSDNLIEMMCSNLHAKLLGLNGWEPEEELVIFVEGEEDFE